jgi:polyisoprenoid-binding protein YceI
MGGQGGTGGQAGMGDPSTQGDVVGGTPVTKATISSGEISFVHVKNGTIEVPATMAGVTGELDFASGADAAGELTIDVGTWASGDAGRDSNVRNYFFKATEHTSATFTLDSLENLPEKPLLPGTEAMAVAKGTLTTYTGSAPVEANIKLTRTDAGYTVQSTENFTVSIAALSFGENLAELIRICAHESIDDSVSVGVNLTLTTAQ